MYRKQIIRIICDTIPDPALEIIIYGSRARGDARPDSDYDIALKLAEKIHPARLSLIKERLEESNIPFKVDIVDINNVTEDLRNSIIEEGVLW